MTDDPSDRIALPFMHRRDGLLRLVPLVSLLFVAVLIFGLNFYYTVIAYPVSDEICRSVINIRSFNDVVEVSRWNYEHWSGRWLGMALYAAYLPFVDIEGPAYTVALFALQTLWLSFFYVAIRGTMSISRGQAFTFSGLLTLIFWSGMAAPLENWYWYTGSFEYVVPLTVGAVAILGTLKHRSNLSFCFAVLAGGIISGINELISVLYLMTLGCVAIESCWYRGGVGRYEIKLVAVIIASLLALLFNVVAPGNMVRANAIFPEHHSLPVLIRSVIQFGKSPIVWLIDPKLWALTMFALFSRRFQTLRRDWCNRPAIWAYIPIAALLMATVCYLLIYYVQGSTPPKRATNTLYAVFIMGWTLGVLALSGRLVIAAIDRNKWRVVQAAGVTALALALLLSPTTEAAIGDLSYAQHIWRPELANRFRHHQNVDVHIDVRPLKLQLTEAGSFNPCWSQFSGSHYRLVNQNRVF